MAFRRWHPGFWRDCGSGVVAASVENNEDGNYFLCKPFACRGQGDATRTWSDVHECRADGVFELPDLLGEGGFSDAETFRRVVEVGVPGDRQEPLDASFGAAGRENRPGGGRERFGTPVISEDVLMRGDPVPGPSIAAGSSSTTHGMPCSGQTACSDNSSPVPSGRAWAIELVEHRSGVH